MCFGDPYRVDFSKSTADFLSSTETLLSGRDRLQASPLRYFGRQIPQKNITFPGKRFYSAGKGRVFFLKFEANASNMFFYVFSYRAKRADFFKNKIRFGGQKISSSNLMFK